MKDVNIEKVAKKVMKGAKMPKDLPEAEREAVIKYLRDENTKLQYTATKVKKMADAVVAGGEIPADLPDEVREAVQRTVDAIKTMAPYTNPDGTGKKIDGVVTYVSERLRPGYIGAEVTSANGRYIQMERGKPYGTLVAIPTDDSVVIGYSFIDEADAKYAVPIVGLYLAFKRAVEGKTAGKHGYEPLINGIYDLDANTKAQLKHFEKRALAYFHPDVFSYSRGQEGKKVVYENYDKIHAMQLAILGPEKMEKAKCHR